MFNWNKKEKPFASLTGFGGGIGGLSLISGLSEKPYFGDIGLIGGGADESQSNVNSLLEITQWVSIPTTGSAYTGGNLTADRQSGAGCSNGLRALYGGGKQANGVWANRGTKVKSIDYQTISTKGTCSDFGDITTNTAEFAACSNGTRGVFGGGENPSTTEVIEYVVIDTLGDADDFGDLHTARYAQAGLSNGTRGIFAAGAGGGYLNSIEYITIDTNGNGTDLCDLNYSAYSLTGCGNRERSIITMGRNSEGNYYNYISYFDPTSTATAQDFGNLTVSRGWGCALNNETRAVFMGGKDSNDDAKYIDYITIASTGDATNFHDLDKDTRDSQGASGD